ncbi:hypothetical protein [Sphingomonas sp.]|uniref:hypothetical protein n=1 Tax=Sphingomonas sp. TaxID=28214 RepID=UPI0035B3A12D
MRKVVLGVALLAWSGAGIGATQETVPPPAEAGHVRAGPHLPPADRRALKERRREEKQQARTGGFVLGALLTATVLALTAKKRGNDVTEDLLEQNGDGAAMIPVAATPPMRVETDADAAVQACAGAVEGEGRRVSPLAQVGQIAAVDPQGEGYAIRGEVLLRASYRDAGDRRGFRCEVDSQAVRTVVIDDPRRPPAR